MPAKLTSDTATGMRMPHPGGRHWNFYLAVAAGILAATFSLAFAAHLFPAVAVSVFSIVYLALTAHGMPKLTPDYLRSNAGDEDAPPLVVFLLTIGIVIYATVAMFMTVNAKSPHAIDLGLGVLSVALSWLMIHAMWGMHYAWEYYKKPEHPAGEHAQVGGLAFPGEQEPDGMDFIYFSLTVAMTDQTSDTDVTTRAMRRVVSGHSLFSYFFNTVVVAAAVNIVVSLGQS